MHHTNSRPIRMLSAMENNASILSFGNEKYIQIVNDKIVELLNHHQVNAKENFVNINEVYIDDNKINA